MGVRDRAGGGLRERFYRSVAETLTLLHTAPGYDRRAAMSQVVGTLASAMHFPLVWIGRREPEQSSVRVLAAAGPSADYAADLRLSADEGEPGGRGPVGLVLRERKARVTTIDAPEFSTWRMAADRYGFGSCIVAASSTPDGGQLVLAAYARETRLVLSEEMLDWAQRLVDELARFWEHQGLLDRDVRMSRYRDAQRMIQRALLDQPDPQAVFRTLAEALVDVAGAAAVDVYTADGADRQLRRVALVGPMAQAMRQLPTPPAFSEGPLIYTPTAAYMSGSSVVRTHPARHEGVSAAWKSEPLAQMGAVGCWPLLAERQGSERQSPPLGVFAVVTVEPDAFDADMCALLDEIADATSLALVQHQQRDALRQEQQRQAYLASHDALTDLPNRRALDRHLEQVLEHAQRSGKLVAVGLLDLDDMKPINDHHGHAAGDRILVETAARLRQVSRREDYVARFGGDEFVLVFEDLDGEQDLDPLLDRVWQALRQPLRVGSAQLRLSASLGIALFPLHASASGEQLLRLADQAMYQVKAQKQLRARWWSLPSPETASDPVERPDERPLTPYGALAAELLEPCREKLLPRLPELAETYYAGLLTHAGVARLLGTLPAADVEAAKRRLQRLLGRLLDPRLQAARHLRKASQAGFFHAVCSVEEVWLLEAVERLRELLAGVLGSGAHRDRRPLDVVLQRLSLESQWQLEAMRDLQRRRVAVLARINALAWSADTYLDLIQGVVDVLAAHKEVTSCAVGRPDAQDQLTYEAVAGRPFEQYLRRLARSEASPITVDATRQGGGPSGRAWRTGAIQRCAHYGTDPAMAAWREVALGLGIVSSVAIPLSPQPYTPVAVLTLYSRYAGGFQSDDQQAFAEQVKTVLDLALVRLSPPRPGAALLPFIVRERWRTMAATTAIQMHYQPVIRLADGRVVEVEALARLRDEDDSLVMPGRFLPALGEDDLVGLFRQALSQAAGVRQVLCQGGQALAVSVNAPAAALEDPRYAAIAAEVLADGSCPIDAVLLEILESPFGSEHAAPTSMAGMQALRALGCRLVEDDLGAGYSSLIRLRQWPFDRVKIDQAIVAEVSDDPLRTLRFIRQLIRLGHDLGLEVVVEGLETRGLIEAALMLDADLGQGYALARPMPPTHLSAWLSGFAPDWDRTRPATALGALAGVLAWEEQFAALPPQPAFWEHHAHAVCSFTGYLSLATGPAAALAHSHAQMHAAAEAGPADPGYRAARDRFMAMLIEHVRREEAALPPG